MNSFLAKKNIFWGVFGVLIAWYFLDFSFFLLSIAMFVLMVFMYRKGAVDFRDNLPGGGDVILSPLDGEVVSIRQNVNHAYFGENLIEVCLSMSYFGRIGIYLPFTCEVVDFQKLPQKKKFGRYLAEGRANLIPSQAKDVVGGYFYKLSTPQKQELGLQALKCFLGSKPRLWIQNGDRGKVGANIGHIPMGGTLLLYLKDNAHLLVKEHDRVKASETPIANFAQLSTT